jgi:hypothetical protein
MKEDVKIYAEKLAVKKLTGMSYLRMVSNCGAL